MRAADLGFDYLDTGLIAMEIPYFPLHLTPSHWWMSQLGGSNSRSGIVVSAVFSFVPCGYGWLLLWQEDENPPFPMKITSWFSCFMFDRRAVIGGLYEDASGIFEWKSLRDFHNLWSKPEIGVHGLLVWKPHPQFSSGGYVTRQSHVRFILSARVSMRIMWFFLRIPGRIALSLVLLSSPW